jgi:hypothetical protein
MLYSIPTTFRRPTSPVHLINFEILEINHILLLFPLHLAPHKVDDHLSDLYPVLHFHECYYFLSVIPVFRDLPVISKAKNFETADLINVNEGMAFCIPLLFVGNNVSCISLGQRDIRILRTLIDVPSHT